MNLAWCKLNENKSYYCFLVHFLSIFVGNIYIILCVTSRKRKRMSERERERSLRALLEEC
jgi:hypothetical protein